jgi:hypothetical protein
VLVVLNVLDSMLGCNAVCCDVLVLVVLNVLDSLLGCNTVCCDVLVLVVLNVLDSLLGCNAMCCDVLENISKFLPDCTIICIVSIVTTANLIVSPDWLVNYSVY